MMPKSVVESSGESIEGVTGELWSESITGKVGVAKRIIRSRLYVIDAAVVIILMTIGGTLWGFTTDIEGLGQEQEYQREHIKDHEERMRTLEASVSRIDTNVSLTLETVRRLEGRVDTLH